MASFLCENCGKGLFRTYYLREGKQVCRRCAERGMVDQPWPHFFGGQGRDAEAVRDTGMALVVFAAFAMALALAAFIWWRASAA
jgi:hypothetical protein